MTYRLTHTRIIHLVILQFFFTMISELTRSLVGTISFTLRNEFEVLTFMYKLTLILKLIHVLGDRNLKKNNI